MATMSLSIVCAILTCDAISRDRKFTLQFSWLSFGSDIVGLVETRGGGGGFGLPRPSLENREKIAQKIENGPKTLFLCQFFFGGGYVFPIFRGRALGARNQYFSNYFPILGRRPETYSAPGQRNRKVTIPLDR